MKSKFSKFGMIAMVFMMIVLTACSNSNNSNSSSNSKNSNEDSGNKAGSFSYMVAGKYMNWLNDLKWFPVIQSKSGIDVELVNGGEDDEAYQKHLELKIGSGQFPDSGIVTLAQADVYGAQNVFLDLKPLIDKHAPNIKKFLEDNSDYASLITSADGRIVGLPQEYPKVSYVTFYRTDLFEKAGITQNPTTTEEFTNALRKLKETFKEDANFFPFTGRDGYLKFTEAFAANDNITNGKVNGIYQNGLGLDLYSEGIKDYIEWYKQLYAEKLIDPEWVAGTATEESWQTKMLTGKGAIGNDFFTRPSWFMNNGGPDNDPKFNLNVMDPFNGQDGKQTMLPLYEPRFRVDRVFVINAKSEDKAETIIKFMDYVFSPEGRNLMDYGVEGESYKAEGDTKSYTVKFEEEGNKPLGTPVWNFLQDRLSFPAPVNNAAYYEWMDELTKSFATTFFDKYTSAEFPQIKYSTEQLKERTTLLAAVLDYRNANLVKFITGERDMSEWNKFLEVIDQTGYKKIVEIDQAAYDAMQ